MKKAEELARLARGPKTTLSLRIDYFFLLRKLRKAAKEDYEIIRFYTTFKPYIVNRLKRDEFKVKEGKTKKGEKYTDVKWIYKKKKKKKNVTDDSDTDNDDTTNN